MGLLDLGVQSVGGIAGAWSAWKQAKLNAAVQRENTDKTIAANKNLAEYQYQQEQDMWNKANAYNTPDAQMKRFKDANLNPNLMYGQGTTGNSPNTLPKYVAPRVEYDYQSERNYPAMLTNYQDMALKSAQIDNVRAQTDRARIAAILTGVEKLRRENLLEWERGPDGLLSSKNVLGINKAKIAGYQATIIKHTIDDQIKKIALSNKNLGARTGLTDTMQKYRAKDVNWYTAKNLTDMISKSVGSIGIAKFLNRRRERYY